MKRNYSLDLVRIVAICAVVMVHSCGGYVSSPANAAAFLAGNIFDSLSRAGVPLFLMLSGALMLDETKQRSMADLLRSAGNILFLIVVWSLIYAGITKIGFPLLAGTDISLRDFFIAVLNGHYHMWYLYMLVGIYLTTPFLRSFVKRDNKQPVLFYICAALLLRFFRPLVTLLSASVPSALFLNDLAEKFHMDFFGTFLAYYLAGWYLVHIGIEKRKYRFVLYCLSFLSAAAIIVLTQITGAYVQLYDYEGILVFFYSIGLFLWISRLPVCKKEASRQKLARASSLSFGVYIIHIVFDIAAAQALPQGIHPVVYIFIRFVLVLGLSYFSCDVLSKIPGLKKLIRC